LRQSYKDRLEEFILARCNPNPNIYKAPLQGRAVRRPHLAAAVNLWAPPPIFDERRTAADNLSERRRCHVGLLVCLIILWHFHVLHDFAINGCLCQDCRFDFKNNFCL